MPLFYSRKELVILLGLSPGSDAADKIPGSVSHGISRLWPLPAVCDWILTHRRHHIGQGHAAWHAAPPTRPTRPPRLALPIGPRGPTPPRALATWVEEAAAYRRRRQAAVPRRRRLTPREKELIIVLDTPTLAGVRSALSVRGRQLLTAYLSHRSLERWEEAYRCRMLLLRHGLNVCHPERGVRPKPQRPLRGPHKPVTGIRGGRKYRDKGWLSTGSRRGRSNEGRVYPRRKRT